MVLGSRDPGRVGRRRISLHKQVFVETLDRPLFSPLVHRCQGCEQIRTIKMRKALGETPGPFPVLHPTTPTNVIEGTPSSWVESRDELSWR